MIKCELLRDLVAITMMNPEGGMPERPDNVDYSGDGPYRWMTGKRTWMPLIL